MYAFETLIFEKENGIAYVTLNRPKFLNAFNVQMHDDLFQVLNAIQTDTEVKVVVFKGAGDRAFCAGADLKEFLSAPPPVAARKIRWTRDVWGLFLNLAQPLIAALNGYVLGSGVEIALCCDIRIAADNACFGLPEAGLGIIPAAGGTQTLPRTVHQGQALEMLYTNRWIDADEAYQIHLVNRVVPLEKLMPTAKKIAQQIASHDPLAVRHAKRAVNKGLALPLKPALHMEKTLATHLALKRTSPPK